jgi:uncharacterized membrane protein YedE/YeeE
MPEGTRLAPRIAVAATIVAAASAAAFIIDDRALVLSLWFGVIGGIILQRGRFCFYCNLADFLERRDASGLLAILAALASGCVLYAFVVSAWLPTARAPDLPPNAHIGPVGPVLLAGSFVFGIGMTLSGSCLSAHFYRLGEGAFGSLVALAGAAIGFALGFLSWNWLYLASVSEAPAVWLPHWLGYAGSTVLALAVLAGLFLLVTRHAAPPDAAPHAFGFNAVFICRWPATITGLLVGTLSAIAYLRVAPLGVTAELGSLVSQGSQSLGVLGDTLLGLDGLRGCVTAVRDSVLSRNGLFVLGLVGGSLAAAVTAGQFRAQWPDAGGLVRRLAGGILLGWGAMVSLGCTIGVLLSGIHAGALSGWFFLAGAITGASIAWKLGRWLRPA